MSVLYRHTLYCASVFVLFFFVSFLLLNLVLVGELNSWRNMNEKNWQLGSKSKRSYTFDGNGERLAYFSIVSSTSTPPTHHPPPLDLLAFDEERDIDEDGSISSNVYFCLLLLFVSLFLFCFQTLCNFDSCFQFIFFFFFFLHLFCFVPQRVESLKIFARFYFLLWPSSRLFDFFFRFF